MSDALNADEAPIDDTAPAATLAGSKSQKLGKTAAVSVACVHEACVATASGRVKVPKAGGGTKTYKLQEVTKPIAKGASTSINVPLSTASRVAIKRALRRGKKITLKLTIIVADAAGNAKELSRQVKLKL